MKATMGKITPAMKKWCARLVNPSAYSWYRNKAYSIYSMGSLSAGAPTYVFADSMEKAGLITWADPDQDGRSAAILTDLGRATAGVS